MGFYDEVVEVPRRTMVLFFVVDTSRSMEGAKMGTVNSAIEEVVPEIRDISETNADAEIKIAVLTFSTGAEWLTPEPVNAEDYTWSYLEAYGVTDLGEACEMLNDKLSKDEFMREATGSFAPAIFLLSDGEPTDNYKRGLEKLKENSWFRHAIKVAVAIGEDANEEVLAEFTGNMEAVITVHTPEALKKWIRFIGVTSSKVGSRNSNAGVGAESGDGSENGIITKQEEMIREIRAQAEEPEDWESYGNEQW